MRFRNPGFIGDTWYPLNRPSREGQRLWDQISERDARNIQRTFREMRDMVDSDDDSIPPLDPPSQAPVYPADIAAGGNAIEPDDGETDDDSVPSLLSWPDVHVNVHDTINETNGANMREQPIRRHESVATDTVISGEFRAAINEELHRLQNDGVLDRIVVGENGTIYDGR